MSERRHAAPSLTGFQDIDGHRVLAVLTGNLDGMVFRCSLDEHWTLHFVSEGCLALTGYDSVELIQQRVTTLEMMTEREDRLRVRRHIERAMSRGGRYRVEYRIRRKDGQMRWVQERGTVVSDERGETVLEGFIEDITEWVETIFRLEEAELRYRSIFENSEVGMYQTSEDGRYLAANNALARLYGYASPQALVAGLSDIANALYVDPARRAQFKQRIEADGVVRDFESEVRCADGRRIWIAENAHAVHAADGCFLYYEGTVEDITDRRRYQHQLEIQASRDALTGLPNRSLLQDRLDQSIARANRQHERLAVLFIDLDNFKVINDSLGHAAGDQLIIEMAQRLCQCVRDCDTVARYGGDEFVLILEGHWQDEQTAQTLERIQHVVTQPVVLAGHSLQVSCSIGVAVYPVHGRDLGTLLRHADAAMYQAKGERKGSYRFYTAQLNEVAQQRLELESALRRALERDEITVAYQPKVDALGRPTGCEALMRWHNPGLGQVPPDRFIPLAEETGLVVPLTHWVLRSACRQASQWLADGKEFGSVAVNLSAAQFRDKDLVRLVGEVLAETGLPPRYLEFEITESSLVADVDRAAATLRGLKALGLRVALDDFGTGYSSLAYLRRFPVDTLKIDRSFVSACDREEDARAIARAVISLGHSLGKSVVAEGVETVGQFHMLVAAGCDEFQGYLFSRPLAPDAAGRFLSQCQAGPALRLVQA